MKKVKLELDFLIGPIIKDVFSISKNKLVTGVDVIDNDSEINNLNDKASALYSSFYEFDENNACRFNILMAKEHLDELMKLITKIKDRLNILNDGSFELNDMVSEQLNRLNQ
ncbi:MAG: hypothetical protein MR766_04310 [Erysipelotrichaceae bacterium]|nr:hypothetical protein [Erysipelotrichaceae bacterium]